MKSAKISFPRVGGLVGIALTINGRLVIQTRSQESVVRELQLQGARELTIEEKFRTELPTSPKSLAAAAAIPFDEPMAAFKLIAACAALEEVSTFPPRERRSIPRAEQPRIIQAS